MKLEDIKIGKEFTYNNKRYLRIDMNLSELFANGSTYNGMICALDLNTYKVICFGKLTDINK